MSYTTPLEYLKSKLEDERSNVVSFLSQGTLKDIEEYRRLCGVIQGLDAAKVLINDLAKRMETDDE
jgi:hypothetical protein